MARVLCFLCLSILCVVSNGAIAQTYQCPMHPHYTAEQPGTCPICGMDLVQMSESASPEFNQSLDAPTPNGRSVVTIAAETIQNMGVRVAPVETRVIGQGIRSYGRVTENARKQHQITARVEGWIEQLSIKAVGDEVKAGESLFTLYSPQLISAQQDYLAALATRNKRRIASSGERLKALGVDDRVLTQLRDTNQRMETVPFYARFDGVVSALPVVEGGFIGQGGLVATIQSYESVWVEASVAEKDLQFIAGASEATVVFPSLGNVAYQAAVDYVYPTIDERSRTGTVRLVLENETGILRPGSYADVNFQTRGQSRLSVPSESILYSSEGAFVVRALEQGRFQPVQVATGVHNRGFTEIVQGVSEGDKIVVSGQFLLDSESSLREVLRKTQGSSVSASSPSIEPTEPTEPMNPHHHTRHGHH